MPHVYGATATAGAGNSYIGTNDLPWAMPAGMPAGGNGASGGFSHIPEQGDSVWVRFLDGEPEKPVWEWGMQTAPQRDNFKLHHYAQGTGQLKVGKPDRATWQKWGQVFEINEGGIIITTSQGYQMVFTDASEVGFDGEIKITTGLGNFLDFDDSTASAKMFISEDLTFNVGADWLAYTDTTTFNCATDFDVVAFGAISLQAIEGIDLGCSTDITLDAFGDIQADAINIGLTATALMSLDFETLFLGKGANEPFVLGTQFSTWATSLLTWLATHVHTSSEPGSPTSPPITPPQAVVQPQVSELLSESILGL